MHQEMWVHMPEMLPNREIVLFAEKELENVTRMKVTSSICATPKHILQGV